MNTIFLLLQSSHSVQRQIHKQNSIDKSCTVEIGTNCLGSTKEELVECFE